MTTGERIKYLREREGISQAGLAKAIGATRASVNAWEMELSRPNAEYLKGLSVHFHVSVDYILGIDNHELISIEHLTPEEKHIVLNLIRHFEITKK